MEIIKSKVKWMERYANPPYFLVEVDKIPQINELYFKKRGEFYYAESNGYACYFFVRDDSEEIYHRNKRCRPYNQLPLGNLNIPDVNIVDEQLNVITKNIIGAWTSRAAIFNELGFGPIGEAHIYTKTRGIKQFSYGALTLDKMKEAAELAKVHLIKINNNYYPSLNPMCLEKPK